jgi:DNA-binding NarL/FixJ family response regulator
MHDESMNIKVAVGVAGDGPGRVAVEAALERSGLPTAQAETALIVLVLGGAGDVGRHMATHPEARVIAVAAAPDRHTSSAILAAGARGIVGGRPTGGELAAAVRAVDAGFVVVPPVVSAAVARPVLTARQKEIVSLLVLGLNNHTIADRLFVTESTVKTHLTTIFNKLGVKSRKEAVDLVLDPSSGLGPGILAMREEEAAQDGAGYRPPTVRS